MTDERARITNTQAQDLGFHLRVCRESIQYTEVISRCNEQMVTNSFTNVGTVLSIDEIIDSINRLNRNVTSFNRTMEELADRQMRLLLRRVQREEREDGVRRLPAGPCQMRIAIVKHDINLVVRNTFANTESISAY